MSRCAYCDVEIRWVKTAANGRAMPVDFNQSPDGNVEIVNGRAVVHPPGQRSILSEDTPLWMPHFATCKSMSDSDREALMSEATEVVVDARDRFAERSYKS